MREYQTIQNWNNWDDFFQNSVPGDSYFEVRVYHLGPELQQQCRIQAAEHGCWITTSREYSCELETWGVEVFMLRRSNTTEVAEENLCYMWGIPGSSYLEAA